MKNAGSKKPILRVSANAFIPKPFTPLQWAPFANDKQIQDKRCELQQQLITFSGVQFTVKSSRAEKLQALLSQGDARIGESLYRAYEQKISPFRQLKKDGFKIAEWLDHEKEQDQLFPWDFLTYPIPRERLWRDYQAFRDGMMQRRVI